MNDESRNAIREVLAPSMYQRMLRTNDGRAYCYECTRALVKGLLFDLRQSHTESYHVIRMEDMDGSIACESCGDLFSEYENESGCQCDHA